MNLKLNRPIIFFDIESTGLNISSDAMIELCFVKIFPIENNEEKHKQEIKTWKIKPWDYYAKKQIPMSSGASEVTGVKDSDLESYPKFIEIIPEVVEWLNNSDLAGYNSAKFDLPMLAEEFERVKSYLNSIINGDNYSENAKDKAKNLLSKIDINLHDVKMIDVQNIYHMMEPRTLKAAYRFYCGGKDFDNAHEAEADTIATYQVLLGQLDKYSSKDNLLNQILPNSVNELSELSIRHKTVDFAGRIILKDNIPTISFGKYKDKSVKEVFEIDRNYFRWISNGDFTLDTKAQFASLEKKFIEEQNEKKQEENNRPVTEEDVQKLKNLFSQK